MRAMLQPGHSISDCGGGTDLIDIIEQMYPKAVGIATSSCTIYTWKSNKFRIQSSHTIAGRPAKAKNITDVLDIWIVPRSIEQRPLNPQCGMHTYQLGPSELYEIKKHAGMHVCDQICIPGTVRVWRFDQQIYIYIISVLFEARLNLNGCCSCQNPSKSHIVKTTGCDNI